MGNLELSEQVARGYVTVLALIANADGVIAEEEFTEFFCLFGVMPGLKDFDSTSLAELTIATIEDINNNVNEQNIDEYITENINNNIPDDSYIKRCLVQAMFYIIKSNGSYSESYDTPENSMAIRIIQSLNISVEELFIEGLVNCEQHKKHLFLPPSEEDIARGFASIWTLVASADGKISNDEGVTLLALLMGCRYTRNFDSKALLDAGYQAVQAFSEDDKNSLKNIIKLIPKDDDVQTTLAGTVAKLIVSDKELNTKEFYMAGVIFDAMEIPRNVLLCGALMGINGNQYNLTE